MNNKQQTAVDLFHDKVNELIVGKKTITSNDLGKIWIEAKEMENEQIEQAYDDAIMKGRQEDGEEYYEKTYGNDKQ